MNTYRTRGVCSRSITFDVAEDGTLHNISFEGGCNGNLQGISALVKGMTPQEAISKIKGIRCGMKSTSCPDQLAKALEKMI